MTARTKSIIHKVKDCVFNRLSIFFIYFSVAKSILQPTPLVMSLQNQLVSQFTSSCADNQHQKARNEQTNEAQKTNNDSDLEVSLVIV